VEKVNPAAPCGNLDNQPHDLYRYLTAKRRRNGIVGPLRNLNIRSHIYPDTVGMNLFRGDITLLRDEGLVEKLDDEPLGYYRVLEDCPHPLEDFFGGDEPIDGQVAPRPPRMNSERVRSGGSTKSPLGSPSPSPSPSNENLYWERSARTVGPMTQLLHHFAQVCPDYNRSDRGILFRAFRAWKKEGIPTKFQTAMVDEFIRHPDWCRRSQRSPVMVFTSHKTELLAIIKFNNRKHAAEDHRYDLAAWRFSTR
jgi:hypothetical protein